MSPNDLIEYPAQPGEFGRRILIDALVAAGSPRTNSLTRLKPEQQDAYDAWVRRDPGANPADDPNDERQQLGHVRGVAADIDVHPAVVKRLEAAGLVRPFSWEPWHWTVAYDVRGYALVLERPDFTTTPDPQEEPDMLILVAKDNSKDGLILKGRTYCDPLASPVVIMSGLEAGAVDYWKGKGIPYRRAEWSGEDIRATVAVKGMHPHDVNTGRTDYTRTVY